MDPVILIKNHTFQQRIEDLSRILWRLDSYEWWRKSQSDHCFPDFDHFTKFYLKWLVTLLLLRISNINQKEQKAEKNIMRNNSSKFYITFRIFSKHPEVFWVASLIPPSLLVPLKFGFMYGSILLKCKMFVLITVTLLPIQPWWEATFTHLFSLLVGYWKILIYRGSHTMLITIAPDILSNHNQPLSCSRTVCFPAHLQRWTDLIYME